MSDSEGAFVWNPTPEQAEGSRWMTGPSIRLQKIFAAELMLEPEPVRTFLNIQQISMEGMRIHADHRFVPGTSLRVQLHTDELLDLPLHVEWHKELIGGMWMVGLRFEPATEREVRSIEWLVQTLALQNRRKFVRVNRVLVVEVLLEAGSAPQDGPKKGSFTMDLSAGGMRMLHDSPLPLGADIPLRILLEYDLPPVEVRGRVAWQKEASFEQYQIGVEFAEVQPEAANRIEEFVEAVLAGEMAGRQIPTLQGFDAE